MTGRLKRIFNELPSAKSFADIGCDHGYIAKLMIESGKCNDITVSDISAPSLNKACILLRDYIEEGQVKAVCCDGLEKVKSDVELVLIAGMGGEEIVKILKNSSFLPPYLVVQPMKNTEKLRKTLFELGYGITRDYLFYDVKYYNLISAELNKKVEPYTENEFIFGRDNLKNKSDDFLKYIKKELALSQKYRENMADEKDIAQIENRIKVLKEVLNEN